MWQVRIQCLTVRVRGLDFCSDFRLRICLLLWFQSLFIVTLAFHATTRRGCPEDCRDGAVCFSMFGGETTIPIDSNPFRSAKGVLSYSGWWFGTCSIFPYVGNSNPNWLIFFRGVQTTNQIITIMIGYHHDESPLNHHFPMVFPWFSHYECGRLSVGK